MSRQVLKLVILAAILAASWFFGAPRNQPSPASAPVATESHQPLPKSGSSRQTWGRMETLADHFARHGGDFQARDADDYAAQAAALLERARTTGLPAKRDADGSLRVFDPATGAFAAYNRDGTTRTFFKPGSSGYFDRQPGQTIDLRTAR